MNMQAIIEKVQKLLALSKSSNVSEAANAAAAANRLIDTYRLSVADLNAEGTMEDPLDQDGGFIYETGKVTHWKKLLLSVLVEHYGLYYYNDGDWSRGRKFSRFRLVGRKSDIAVCRYMFAWLVVECQRLADIEAKGQGRVFVASYCEGFVNGIYKQLKLSRAEVEKTASSSAIVKIDARASEAKNYAYGLVKGLHQAKSASYRHVDYDAFYAGKTKGENIHLGSSLSDGKAPKVLGS